MEFKTKKISLADAINRAYGQTVLAVKKTVLTKKRFGELMHDDALSDDEKREYVRIMKEQGGYDGLPDD